MRLGEICDLNKFNKQISAKEIENMNVGKGSIKLLPSSKNYDWWTDEITAQNYINEGEVIALGVARYANIKKHKGKFVSANNKLLSIKEKVKEEILFDYVYFLLEIYAQKLYKSGSQYPQFDTNKFDSFLIPKPKMEIQSQIVSECEEVEKQFNTIKMSIEEYKNLIKAILVKTGICEDSSNLADIATILATLATLINQITPHKLNENAELLESSLRGSEATEAIHIKITPHEVRTEKGVVRGGEGLDFAIRKNPCIQAPSPLAEKATSDSKMKAESRRSERVESQKDSSDFAKSTNEANLNALKALLSSLPVPPKEGWEKIKLGEVCEILDNMREPINATEREQRLQNATHKYAYYGATGQIGYIDDFICDFEAILLGEDGAPFLESLKDKAYLVNGKYWVNNHAHILRAKQNVSINKFVCYCLNSVNYAPYVTGTTRLKLNQYSMQQIKIPLPPLKEQEKIVSAIEYIENEMTDLAKRLDILESQKSKILEKYL